MKNKTITSSNFLNPFDLTAKIFPLVINEQANFLKEKDNRELFGLCLVALYKNERIRGASWLISMDEKWNSDDGVVLKVIEKNTETNQFLVHDESIEQVWLPAMFDDKLKSTGADSLTDHITKHVLRLKNKGAQYSLNKSLFILNDIRSMNGSDVFHSVEFCQKIYEQTNFLNIYFVALIKPINDHSLTYHFTSLSNQVLRQELNAEYYMTIHNDGSYEFKLFQNLNVT